VCFDRLELPSDLSGTKILEVGCGAGDWGRLLALRQATVIGVDIADAVIACNQKLNADLPTYSSRAGDVENRALFPANSFDAATCFNVLHHFPDTDAVIENLAHWLCDGGVVYAVEPNGGNLTNRISKFVRRLIAPVMTRLIQDTGLATVNEVRDHSMPEYLQVFARHGFECTLKMSLLRADPFPRVKPFNSFTVIAVIKWMLNKMIAHSPVAPINRGNPLVFKMRKTGRPRPAVGTA